jgi:hypothetical protein
MSTNAIEHKVNLGCGEIAYLTNDYGGGDVVAGPILTEPDGTATFYLDSGSYFLWQSRPGDNFVGPTVEKVA